MTSHLPRAETPPLRLVAPPGDPAVEGALATIVHVVGTRSDAAVVAPVAAALERHATFRQVIVHTGGRDRAAVFAGVGLPEPDEHLGVGEGSAAVQTAEALAAAEPLLVALQPAAVTVAGAANASLGCGLAAASLGIPVARLEAGLRERDWSMPEEVNRILLDTLADLLFASGPQAVANLAAEGVGGDRVRMVGSAIVDSLRRAEAGARAAATWSRYALEAGRYVLATLQRPVNIDDDERLARIVEGLAALAGRVPVVFPMHPRTQARLEEMGDAHRLAAAGVRCVAPLPYVEFLSLEAGAGAIVTDSGPVQEEASALGVSCFTLGASTEREATVTQGTNTLLGHDPRDIAIVRPRAVRGPRRPVALWDGRAGERMADELTASYALVR